MAQNRLGLRLRRAGPSCLWCAMQSPTDPVSCNVLILPKGNQAGSAVDVLTSNCHREAPRARRREPQRKQTRIGLVRLKKLRAARLPKMSEASTRREAVSGCTGGALRGERGRRAPKGQLGTWESRPRRRAAARQRQPGINNRWRCGGWQSERPIVAMKRLTPVERRGLGCEGAESEVRAA